MRVSQGRTGVGIGRTTGVSHADDGRGQAVTGRLQRFWQALLTRMLASLAQSAEYSRPNMVLVGAVGVVGHPLYYLIWAYVFPQPYESLAWRAAGAALCVPLLFVNHWPQRLRPLLVPYWLFALLFELPFFFTYMLLRNGMSLIWGMSTMAALFLLLLVIYDWVMISLMALAGSALAWFAYWLTVPHIEHAHLYLQQVPIYLFTLVAGSIFNYKAELVKQEKLSAMAAVGSTIAHELRTPLLGIRSGIAGLKRYVPQLLEGYELALRHGLPVQRIRAAHYRELLPVLHRVEAETHYSNIIIDMLLLNSSRTAVDPAEFHRVSMVECVDTALARYPFKSPNERRKIHWRGDADFVFWGSDVLMVHVLFNLIKNALQFIAEAGKGDISIWVENGPQGHALHFYDTGRGIEPERVHRVFERFYTSMAAGGGAGIGLAFCKVVMKSFGGDIACRSRHGHFTEFVMDFPKVERDGND